MLQDLTALICLSHSVGFPLVKESDLIFFSLRAISQSYIADALRGMGCSGELMKG